MRRRIGWSVTAMTLLASLLLAGCSGGSDDSDDADAARADTVAAPTLGDCRRLTPKDVTLPSNASATVDCDSTHTAETFAVGTLSAKLAAAGYDSPRLGAFAYRTCGDKFAAFMDADESLVMRTVVSWAWFRPSRQAWDRGARWYRCDVVGGGAESSSYVDLPTTARGLLTGGRPPDRWLVCVDGASVQASPKIPCSRPHTWRAVTAIKVGDPGDAYPGDRLVEVKSRDYCSDYVGAWLGYPDSYDFGYTWFHQSEWDSGNRRSVCWARTAQ